MSFVSGVIAVSKCFKHGRRSTAIGIVYAGGSVGMMVCPPTAEYLMSNYGWRATLIILGATGANLIVCGMLIAKSIQLLNEEQRLIQEAVPNRTFAQYAKSCIENLLQPFYILLHVPSFIAILTARLFSTIVYSGWAIFLVPHAIDKGVSTSDAVLLSTIGGIAALCGRLLPGPFVDKGCIKAINLIVLATLVNAAGYLLDKWFYQFWSLSLAAIVNGFYFGLEPTIAFPLCDELLGTGLSQDGFSLTIVPSAVGEILGGTLIGKAC